MTRPLTKQRQNPKKQGDILALERKTEGCVIQSALVGELGKIWGDGIVVRQTEGFQEAQGALVVKVEIGADILALERETEGLLGEIVGGVR